MRLTETLPTPPSDPDLAPRRSPSACPRKVAKNRYAFFELRGVDWKQQYHAHRPRVQPSTTPAELFAILQEMLGSLRDGHVELNSAELGKEWFVDESAFLKAFSIDCACEPKKKHFHPQCEPDPNRP